MGNRYTETTLTERELDTLYRVKSKLDTIMLVNLDKSNPDRKALTHLMTARDNITKAINRVRFMKERN